MKAKTLCKSRDQASNTFSLAKKGTSKELFLSAGGCLQEYRHKLARDCLWEHAACTSLRGLFCGRTVHELCKEIFVGAWGRSLQGEFLCSTRGFKEDGCRGVATE